VSQTTTCPTCGKIKYSNPAPVVITLIRRGREVLLAKGMPPKKHFSCIAGFIESGETAEEAARREVLEEVGVTIKNIQYFGSQHWPHPNNLMLGFTAEWDGGEIKTDPSEITEARWFSSVEGVTMPLPESIAYRMIMAHFGPTSKS
jgi:NAD+ diphosphatase